MHEAKQAENRLRKLERTNKLLIAITISMSASVLVGAVSPPDEVLRAERFVVVDDRGQEWGELSSSSGYVGLYLYDSNGDQRYSSTLTKSSGSVTTKSEVVESTDFTVLGKNGERRADFGARSGLALLNLYPDVSDIPGISLVVHETSGAMLTLRNESGSSVVGASILPEGDPVLLMMRGGNVVWQADY